jgi:hypothetical protein
MVTAMATITVRVDPTKQNRTRDELFDALQMSVFESKKRVGCDGLK